MSAHRARKRFGQHFLVAENVISEIASAVAAASDDTIVEIGPGQGALTVPLVASGAEVHAIEFDRDLAPRLRERFADRSNIEIHEADALSFDYASLGSDLRIVGNLPYNISTPLLFALIGYRAHVRDLYLMLQKEVVDRMTAVPGTKSYGRLTIMLGCYLQAQPLFDVPPDSFAPPPKVMSTVVALRPLPEGSYDVQDHAALSTLVAQAFSKRRKTIRNALSGIATIEQLTLADINPQDRPEQIGIGNWVALANLLGSSAAD